MTPVADEVQGHQAGLPPIRITRLAATLRAHVLGIRVAAVVLWLAALVVTSRAEGIPFDRVRQSMWILAAILAATMGSPWRRIVQTFGDWIPWVGFLFLYDYTRGFADTLGRPVHLTQPLAVDRALGGGQIPTRWLQERLYDAQHLHWWDVVSALVYTSHFILPWVIAGVLYVRSRARWAAFARRVLVLSYASLVTYSLYPAAPPWFASREGLTEPIARISTRGFYAIGLDAAVPLINLGQGSVNLVAAVPSLHAAFALLICLQFWRSSRRTTRTLLAAYPLAMGFALVYTGEHYIVDVVIGAIYALATMFTVGWMERAWGQRTACRAAGEGAQFQK